MKVIKQDCVSEWSFPKLTDSSICKTRIFKGYVNILSLEFTLEALLDARQSFFKTYKII